MPPLLYHLCHHHCPMSWKAVAIPIVIILPFFSLLVTVVVLVDFYLRATNEGGGAELTLSK